MLRRETQVNFSLTDDSMYISFTGTCQSQDHFANELSLGSVPGPQLIPNAHGGGRVDTQRELQGPGKS